MSQQNPDSEAVENEADDQDFTPVGTMALMVILAALILGLWLFMYFGVFVPRGVVS